MKRRTQILLALISLMLAGAAGLYVFTTFNQMVATAQVTTPANTIPAGALIDATMLTERDVPPDVARDTLCVALMLIQLRAAMPL